MNTTSSGFGDLVANLGTPLYPQFGPLPQSEPSFPAPSPAAAPTTATTATAEPASATGSSWLTWLFLAALAMGGWYYFYPEQVHAVYRKVKGYIS